MFPIMLLDQAHQATGGIGGRDLPAPQAGLMAQLTLGIVGGQMAWGLLLMGLAFGLALVMIKAPSPMLIAVGMYLPLETTGAIFLGGVIKWLADKTLVWQHPSAEQKVRSEEGGTLLASGFIAGEAITGILLPALFPTSGSITQLLTGRDELRFLAAWGGYLSLIAFAVLAYSLIRLPLRRRR
jgi:uncharacterized oligopeptide transporter (OPT) family protein